MGAAYLHCCEVPFSISRISPFSTKQDARTAELIATLDAFYVVMEANPEKDSWVKCAG